MEGLKVACGVFGAADFEGRSVFPLIYWGLRAQNHRGHQSYGFLTYDRGFHVHKSLGLIPKLKAGVMQKQLKRLIGHVGIGNVRYTTSGGADERSLMKNAQPVIAEYERKKVAISFNGNVVNIIQLKDEFNKLFLNITYESDMELICYEILKGMLKVGDLMESVKACIEELEGAFSVAGVTEDGTFFAFKDPYGIRPLCAGFSEDRNAYAVSSESVGLDINDLTFDFEVEPGELIVATNDGFERSKLVSGRRKAFCAFEFAYFARPDSRLGDKYVYEVREEFGRNLASEYADVARGVDVILSMPETAEDAALGLHEATGLRWERALRRHRYVTERAFILLPAERYETVGKKVNVLASKIRGKRVIVVDDSIVRGDTTKVIVRRLRKMGAKEVHLFITFPRIRGPCFYGIDMATYSELIGSMHEPHEIAEIVGADSVNYQSVNNFVKATGFSENELCLGCVTLNYPTPLAQKLADEGWKRVQEGQVEVGRLYECS